MLIGYRWWRRWAPALLVCAFCAAFPVAVWWAALPGRPPCETSKASQNADCDKKGNPASKITAAIGHWIHENHDDIAAASTFVIAIFTISLWFATRKLSIAAKGQIEEAKRLSRITGKQTAIAGLQADIAQKQHAIGRLQFIADKRPRLRIRHVGIDHPVPAGKSRLAIFQMGHPVRGSLVVANVGGTDATIEASFYRFYWTNRGLPMAPPLEEKTRALFDLPGPNRLQAGESRSVPIESFEPMDFNADDIVNDRAKWRIYLIGSIKYSDVSFPPVERFMGFCREYRLSKLPGGEGKFYPVENEPDYEYED